MSVSLKLVLKSDNSAEPEIRRLSLTKSEIALDNVRSHAKKLFKLRDDVVWYFKWQDDEGDMVTITEDYELLEVAQANAFAVRLIIHVEQPNPPKPAQPQRYHRRWCHPNKPQQSLSPQYAAICDLTNSHLRIGEGNWYHQPGTSTDICVEEFSKLSQADQQRFVQVTKPSDLGDDQTRYQIRAASIPQVSPSTPPSTTPATATTPTSTPFKCKKTRCQKSTQCHHATKQKQQAQQQQQQEQHKQQPPPKCPPTSSDQFGITELMHLGWCDVAGSMLVAGQGWYHKRNSTYDLCEKEYNKLNATDKKQFVRVDKPEDLGTEQQRYSTLGKVGSVFEQVMQGLCRASGVATHNQHSTQNQSNNAASCATPCSSSQTPKKSMRIVSGPSVPDETVVETGSHLIPVWEVENTGSTLWIDVRVKPQKDDANRLQVKSDGFEVPVVGAGDRSIVSVDFVIPEDWLSLVGSKAVVDSSDGVLVDSVFELVDADGNGFGEQLKLKLRVVPKKQNPPEPALLPVENELELVARLCDMGFANQTVCTRVLRQHQGDVTAAALDLLRAQSKQSVI